MPLVLNSFWMEFWSGDHHSSKENAILNAHGRDWESGSVVKEQSAYMLKFDCRCIAQSNFQTLGVHTKVASKTKRFDHHDFTFDLTSALWLAQRSVFTRQKLLQSATSRPLP
jgi:hypothetical protein